MAEAIELNTIIATEYSPVFVENGTFSNSSVDLCSIAMGMIAIKPNIRRPTKEATLFTKPASFTLGMVPIELLMLINSLIEL